MGEEKATTKRSITSEINKTKRILENRLQKQSALNNEISELKNKISELENQLVMLHQEKLQRKIADKWLKDGKMSDTQILKLVELGSLIHSKIEGLDSEKIVAAIDKLNLDKSDKAVKPLV